MAATRRKRTVKKLALPASTRRRKRHKKPHPLVLPKFEVLPDGAHAVTIPVYTECFVNGSQGFSKGATFAAARAKKEQRNALAHYFFGIGTQFRGVTLVRLAPSDGLDTGNLWNALKAVQDEVAAHLGIDDGPTSPATWEVENERAAAYGVRVELRKDRAKSKVEIAQAFALLARMERLPLILRSMGFNDCQRQGLERAATEVELALRGAA